MGRTGWLVVWTLAVHLALTGGDATAKKGGGGGGGGNGGGGDEPPAAAPEIAYFLSKGDKLMVMDTDGANATLVLRRVNGFAVQPAWSSDGTQLIFNATNSGSGVYVASASGGKAIKLTSTSSQYVNRPGWSPASAADGRSKILFEDQAANGSRDLFLMNTDGTGRVNLTNTAGVNEEHPAWSPDATQFAAVVSSNDGDGWGSDVVVYDLDYADGVFSLGETPSTITSGTALSRGDLKFLAWGRANDRIAVSFSSATSEQRDIWILDADTDGDDGVAPVNLTDTSSASERHPAWSPDDSKVAYEYDDGDARGVYVVGENGGTAIQLAVDGRAPDWKR